jgi:Guanylate-binding protein, N-terminal domain
MLDTEGIDAWDQTGTYSVQIFSLAVLLSSLFVYNQMGGIDEAAVDRLSLVTEMTKHIRVQATKRMTQAPALSAIPAHLYRLCFSFEAHCSCR